MVVFNNLLLVIIIIKASGVDQALIELVLVKKKGRWFVLFFKAHVWVSVIIYHFDLDQRIGFSICDLMNPLVTN